MKIAVMLKTPGMPVNFEKKISHLPPLKNAWREGSQNYPAIDRATPIKIVYGLSRQPASARGDRNQMFYCKFKYRINEEFSK